MLTCSNFSYLIHILLIAYLRLAGTPFWFPTSFYLFQLLPRSHNIVTKQKTQNKITLLESLSSNGVGSQGKELLGRYSHPIVNMNCSNSIKITVTVLSIILLKLLALQLLPMLNSSSTLGITNYIVLYTTP